MRKVTSLDEEFWETRYVLLAVRLLATVLGLLRVVISVRLVSVPEYALIGIAEAWRMSIFSFTSLGIAEALIREGSATAKRADVGFLLTTAYCWGVVLTLVSAAITGAVALYIWLVAHDGHLAALLCLTIVVSFFERGISYASAAVRAIRMVRLFVQIQVAQAVWLLALTVGLMVPFRVDGYFHSVWISNLVAVVILHRAVAKEIPLPSWRAAIDALHSSTRKLWAVSWFIYWYKNISSAWDRFALLVASVLLPREAVGFISIALEFGRRLALVNQALFVTTVARLTAQLRDNAAGFKAVAVTEIKEISWFNIGGAVIMLIGYVIAGPYLFGRMRYEHAFVPFVIFLPGQLAIAIAAVVLYAVLVPLRALSARMLWNSLAGVAAGVALTYVIAKGLVGLPPAWSVSIGMLFGGVCNFVVMWRSAQNCLQALPVDNVPQADNRTTAAATLSQLFGRLRSKIDRN